MISWFKIVPHHERTAHEASGWVFDSELGPTHGHWSILMRWTGEGDPA